VWSYNSDSVGTVDKDTVRFLLGDTDSDDPLLQDEEIQFTITSNSSVYHAAAMAAEAVAAKYGKDIQKTVGPLSINLAQRANEFRSLATRLRSTANRSIGAPPQYFGDSYSDKDDAAQDTDKIGTAIKIGGMDNPSIDNADSRTRYF
jgi:hypothetical protein